MRNTIYFQMYTVKSNEQAVEKHHFVEAETPDLGKEKVVAFYSQSEQVTDVILRSSTKATHQDPKKYKMLIQ